MGGARKMARTYTQKVGRQTGYAVERARRMAAEARLSELRLGELEGNLVPIADVRATLTAWRAEIRARVLSMPGKWAARTATVGRTTGQAQLHLEEIANDLLETLRHTGAAIRDRTTAAEAPRQGKRRAPAPPVRRTRRRGRD